ncbi:6457_t:CDS:1 [Dentiscutata erythropus]|uniref:6457_t:CDS:1 n=1 Tax=Dentiscutata erythropus TaxID=1348616 RepID=A0A9N9NBQ1_9GLOM|nr:6457_t:CDS:1 [Dentiscutata erythropus]
MRITRSLKLDPNGQIIHALQEHIKFLNREIKRCKKESHINLLNEEIQRAKILEEKLRLKEITIETANQELNKLRQEITLLKGIIEEKNKTITALQEENGNLRNTNDELTVEVEHLRTRNNNIRTNCNNFISIQQEQINELQRTLRIRNEVDHDICNWNITWLEERISYFENREIQHQRGETVDPYLPRSNAFIGEHEFNQQFNLQ